MDRKSKAWRNNAKINIGWREWISFPNYDNFRLKAKIDSGARTSALHATHLQEFEKD
ncbi:MAG: RimK/LysX family protein, partial [Candidatus Neomarinimicrobiota bacterium]|nr:RimK/LysX family protein [Candidatus Neomarinimicrobiota bacterium]